MGIPRALFGFVFMIFFLAALEQFKKGENAATSSFLAALAFGGMMYFL